jgi:hypothetical protein
MPRRRVVPDMCENLPRDLGMDIGW